MGVGLVDLFKRALCWKRYTFLKEGEALLKQTIADPDPGILWRDIWDIEVSMWDIAQLFRGPLPRCSLNGSFFLCISLSVMSVHVHLQRTLPFVYRHAKILHFSKSINRPSKTNSEPRSFVLHCKNTCLFKVWCGNLYFGQRVYKYSKYFLGKRGNLNIFLFRKRKWCMGGWEISETSTHEVTTTLEGRYTLLPTLWQVFDRVFFTGSALKVLSALKMVKSLRKKWKCEVLIWTFTFLVGILPSSTQKNF